MELFKFIIIITICVKTVYMRHNYNLNSIGNSHSGLDKINEAKHPFHPTYRHHHLRHGHIHHNASKPYGIIIQTTTTISTTTIKPTTPRHVVNEDIKNNKENQQDNYLKYANDNTDNDDNDDDEDDDEFDYEYDDVVTSTTVAPTTSTTSTTTRRPRTTTESPIIKPVKMAYESLRNSNDPNYYYHHTSNHNIIKHYNNHHKNHHRGSTTTIETKSLKPATSHQRNGDSKLAKRYLPHSHHNHHQQQHHNHHQSHEYALQHDEAVRSNENNSTEFSNPGELTEHKFAEYSDRSAVQRNMYKYLRGTGQPNAEMKILAEQHVRHVKDQGQCGMPKPKLVQVNHDASKQYFPHCTILHVCSNESGCCANDAHICAPKIGSIVEVELHFAVIVMVGGRSENRYDTKKFLNHTQCECVPRSGSNENYQNAFYMAEIPSRRRSITPARQPSQNANRRKRCPRYFVKVVLQQDYDEESEVEEEDENLQQEVSCDCTSSNRECKSFKEGFENFSILDRKCIREGNCIIPICEHGQYDSVRGRCPQT